MSITGAQERVAQTVRGNLPYFIYPSSVNTAEHQLTGDFS
jgi:hypothetical protein